MTGFTLAAAASILAGLSIGTAAAVGVTLAVEGHTSAPTQPPPASLNLSRHYPVNYGDRCWHGHCIPVP
jgi:hypothetical protein